ncbi:MAG: hypothetical protein LBV73_31640 [Paraburkholderia sp.]|jgi:hypothetical protein|nr:hypothetical protein [Paraburkholderia sp.]
MTMPPSPEQEPDDVSEPGRDDAARSSDPARLTRGAWFSLAISLAFFLLMVAIGLKYGVARHPPSKAAEPERALVASPFMSPFMSPLASASLPFITPAPLADNPDALLARAHDCAATAQWDCVISATSGVITQRGNTPETKALLAQAMIRSGWVPGSEPAPSIKANARNMREVSATPAGAKPLARHGHRHMGRAARLRYTAITRRNSTDEMADIYRH